MFTALFQRPSIPGALALKPKSRNMPLTDEEPREGYSRTEALHDGVHIASITQVLQSRHPNLNIIPVYDMITRGIDRGRHDKWLAINHGYLSQYAVLGRVYWRQRRPMPSFLSIRCGCCDRWRVLEYTHRGEGWVVDGGTSISGC